MVYRLDLLKEKDCYKTNWDAVQSRRQCVQISSLAKDTFARVQKYVGCSGEDECGLQG